MLFLYFGFFIGFLRGTEICGVVFAPLVLQFMTSTSKKMMSSQTRFFRQKYVCKFRVCWRGPSYMEARSMDLCEHH